MNIKGDFRIFIHEFKNISPMKENDLVSVFVGTALNARYLEAALAQANIPCLIRNGLKEAKAAGFGGPGTDDSCQIFVELQDYEEAEKLIFDYEKSGQE